MIWLLHSMAVMFTEPTFSTPPMTIIRTSPGASGGMISLFLLLTTRSAGALDRSFLFRLRLPPPRRLPFIFFAWNAPAGTAAGLPFDDEGDCGIAIRSRACSVELEASLRYTCVLLFDPPRSCGRNECRAGALVGDFAWNSPWCPAGVPFWLWVFIVMVSMRLMRLDGIANF